MNDRMSAKKAALILTALVAFISYDRFIEQPRRDEETRLFQSLKPADITRIDIQGVYADSRDLVKARFSIQDAGQIQSVCEAMREAREYSPSHPVAEWNCELHFVTAARTWCAQISSTSNSNGVLIYLDGGNTLRNDNLGPMLEKIVTDHAQTRPPHPRP